MPYNNANGDSYAIYRKKNTPLHIITRVYIVLSDRFFTFYHKFDGFATFK